MIYINFIIVILLILLLKFKKRFFIGLFIIWIFFVMLINNSKFKTFLITTSMSTNHHQYIAKFIYSDIEIERILNKNKVIDQTEITDLSLLDFKHELKPTNKYERKILKYRDHDYKLFKLSGRGYQGYLVAIYKPENVSIALSSKINTEGEYITKVSNDNNAQIAINASGYYDPNWDGNGAIAHGIVVKNKELINEYDDASVDGGLIGITTDNKLFLGNITKNEIENYSIRDAISFGPYLIINGKKCKVIGDGGLGVAPRTAIGQRKDGIYLFLVIDGRRITSIGASLKEVQKIMDNYGAYNATNLDGGSSSELLINGKIVNHPVGGGKNGLRKMPTYFILEK